MSGLLFPQLIFQHFQPLFGRQLLGFKLGIFCGNLRGDGQDLGKLVQCLIHALTLSNQCLGSILLPVHFGGDFRRDGSIFVRGVNDPHHGTARRSIVDVQLIHPAKRHIELNLTRKMPNGEPYHVKGRGNGYVMTYGGKRFYFSGDTEGTPEMRALKDIDVAFVCMNVPYTMTPEEAADAVKAFHPKVVIPYHYQGSDPTVFKKALDGTGIEVRLLDFYPKLPAKGGA